MKKNKKTMRAVCSSVRGSGSDKIKAVKKIVKVLPGSPAHLVFMGCQQKREKNGRPGRKKGPTHFVLRAEPNFG